MKKKQVKTVQNNFYGENWLETTYFWEEVINSNRQLRGKRLPFGVNVNLNLSIECDISSIIYSMRSFNICY